MIGNDIIDLAHARQESNWRRRGFLDKLFTPHEQQLIQSASDPDVMVWTLWSMKESVYKAVVRETGQRFFAPQKLACFLRKSTSGTVEGSVFYRRTYATTSIHTTHYVASVAFASDSTPSFNQVIVTFECTAYQDQHRLIREQLTRHYATCFSVSESQIKVQKNEAGVPTLFIGEPFKQPVNKAISLSHHGRYGAFVIP